MSEIKKVPFVSFPGSKTKDREVENVAKTFRISFDLTRTDEDTCPMFNYKEELSSAKRKEKLAKNGVEKGQHKNGLDPYLDDNDDDVRRIAIEMEAKYGVSGVPKKKRKGRKDDYADIGMGYDESDSFIDNTDGYDEIIPQNVTTLHGGFYINCGALEFKTDDEASSNISSSSSSDDSSDDSNAKKKNRKRILSDTDDDDDSQKNKKDKMPPIKKLKLANGQQKIKKKFLTPDKIKPKKKRILPLHSELPLLSINRLSDVIEEAPTAHKQTADHETDNINRDKEDFVYKKTMSLDNVTDIINSVALGEHSHFLNNLTFCSTPLLNDIDVNSLMPIATIDIDDNDDDSASKSAPNNLPNDIKEIMETVEEDIALPENLPNDILCIIDAIKQAATINISNNASVFSSQVNNLILSFERKCKCLGKQSRSKIYAYLAAFTKCKKDSLVRRARNLVIQDDDTKLMHHIDLLRKKIDEVMPAIRDAYEQMRKHIELRKLSNEEDTKNLRMPKKTFPWTEEIKKWIRDIYTLKRKHFVNQGIVKETLDAQLEGYFKTEIQILWSDSWISLHYLMKIAKNEKKPEKPPNATPQILTNKPPKQPTADKETNDVNSVIRTTTVLQSNSGVFNNDHQAISDSSAKPSIKQESSGVITSASKTSEKLVSVFFPSVPESQNLPQVSITPITVNSSANNPTDKPQLNSIECEIVDISVDTQQQKKPVDRIKTISEILKMNRAKKEAAAAAASAAAAAASSVRSSSPSITNAPTTCQIIDLTSNTADIGQVKKRPGPKCSKVDSLEDPTITKPKPTPTTDHPNHPPITQQKPGQDTAEIQKVMEDLKALQQMTYAPAQPKPVTVDSPSTSNQQPSMSVIALNKNYSGSSSTGATAKVLKSPEVRSNSVSSPFNSSGETSFQEAFQRQFMASLQQQQQQQQSTAAGTTKSNSYNNSHDKFSSASASLHAQNKISTTSNNNYEPTSSAKVKNNSYPSQSQSQKPKQPSQK